MNVKKTILYALLISIILFAIVQAPYEFSLKQAELQCTHLSNRKRLKYTPAITYGIIYLTNRKDRVRDYKSHQLLDRGCGNMHLNAFKLLYINHCYISENEKDSLVTIFDSAYKKMKHLPRENYQ